MSFPEIAGYLAALLVFFTFYMKTMVPLRVMGICGNCAFIAYGYLFSLYPILALHLILLPLNSLRLRQMVQLTRQVREASQGDLNMEWLRPFASKRQTHSGDVIFRKGDKANEMFLVVEGRYRLSELGFDVIPGQVVGELGLLTPDQSRTQTLECTEAGAILHISYEQVKQLYYQNPRFGFYFLQLTTRRLFENVIRMEGMLVERDQEILQLKNLSAVSN